MTQFSKTLRNLGILSSVIIFSLTISLITFAAWTEPTVNPPGGNVDIPVNVGATLQNKTGSLGLGGLVVSNSAHLATQSGSVGIGTTNPSEKLTLNGDLGFIGGDRSIKGNSTGRLNIYNNTSGSNSLAWIEMWGDHASRAGELTLGGAYISFRTGSTTSFSGTEQMTITADGKVGMGTTTPNAKLHLNDTSGNDVIVRFQFSGNTGFRFDSNRGVAIGSNSVPPDNGLHVQSEVQAAAYYYTSDIRQKENIKPLENSLDGILKLNGISYTLKTNGEKSLGFSAQEVREIFPDAVKENSEGMLSINGSALIAPLVEAVKEQNARIDTLERELELMRK